MDASVFLPFVPVRPEQALPFAGLVHWSNASRLWLGYFQLIDNLQVAAHCAGAGFRVPIGTGVSVMPVRHPYDAALTARSAALATGLPVIAGFGPGGTDLQQAVLGWPYRSPLTAASEYATITRRLLAGEEVHVEGEYFACHAAIPPFPGPAVQVGLGVLGPGMAAVAGRVADAAITWLTPAAYLAETVVPALRQAAQEAGRPVPRIVAIVPVAPRGREKDLAGVVLASNGVHLTRPHYQVMLHRAGIPVEGKADAAEAHLLMRQGAFLAGDLDTVLDGLKDYEKAGVDEVVINVTGVYHTFGRQAALDDLQQILAGIG